MPIALALLAATSATPAAAAVDVVDARLRGAPTQVAVLGTAHLSGLPASFRRDQLVPLIERLARWRPRIVTIEGLSGADCDHLRAFRFRYTDTADTYCWDPTPARAALKLDQAGAEAAIAALLDTLAADRAAPERRRLAALFLASGDRASALVQWLRLPPGERHADAGLTPPLVAVIEKSAESRNESYAIAAPLAVRLGLERVHPVDDHSGDAAAGPTGPSDEKDMTAIWANPTASAQRKAGDAQTTAMIASGDVIGWYRWVNAPAQLRTAMTADFAAAIADASPAQTGRKYLAYWETRNLRMVANIRTAYGPTPGVRVLSIVGSSHKPYFERYLGMLSDTRIVAIETLLD